MSRPHVGRRAHRIPRQWRWILRGVASTAVAADVWMGADLGPVLAAPSQDTLVTKTAEWARGVRPW